MNDLGTKRIETERLILRRFVSLDGMHQECFGDGHPMRMSQNV